MAMTDRTDTRNRFIEPSAQALSGTQRIESLHKPGAIDPLTRVYAAMANELAARQVQQTVDPDLGLKAGRSMTLGRAGVLDYAMRSAGTMREALEVASRYRRLFGDLLDVGYSEEGAYATIRIDIDGEAPRAVTDFAMSAWFTNHVRESMRRGSRLECWFPHHEPPDSTEYRRTFAPAALRFDAPFFGFSLERGQLDAPLPTADRATHAVLCEYAAWTLSQIPGSASLLDRVRGIVTAQLGEQTPTVSSVAARLRMTPRTFRRCLELEGMPFSALLDRVRRDAALRYVNQHSLEMAEIAARLRFAHVQGFYRAFKRWTGQTPVEYRSRLQS